MTADAVGVAWFKLVVTELVCLLGCSVVSCLLGRSWVGSGEAEGLVAAELEGTGLQVRGQGEIVVEVACLSLRGLRDVEVEVRRDVLRGGAVEDSSVRFLGLLLVDRDDEVRPPVVVSKKVSI